MSDISDTDEVEEISSAAQVVQKFQEWWISERNCPVLLPYQGDLVDCLLDQLEHMRQGLAQLKANDLRASLHRLEVERIQYLINDYLRCRLQKIHKILPQKPASDVEELLSEQERTFVEEIINASQAYFHEAGLSHMPAGMQQFSLPPKEEEKDHYVFCRVKKSAQGLMVDADLLVDFEEGKSTQSASQLTSTGAVGSNNEEEMRKKTRPVPVVFWKTVDVMKWLKRCCVDHYQLYAHVFLEHDITGRSLVRINDISLEKMGIRDKNHRSELLREILKLKLKSDILEIKDLERDGAEFFKTSS